MDQREVDAFWEDARVRASLNPAGAYLGRIVEETLQPPAWSFGADPVEADRMVELVLAGTKTAMTSVRSEYDADGADLPEPGDLAIVLDGQERPRVLIRITDVRVVRFADVDAEHARAEGEGDLSVEQWRQRHLGMLAAAAPAGHVDEQMQVVLERFRVLVGHGREAQASVPTG
ncbi:ASCH domain-containing protein [Ornithinimicrobium sediminis]|uniref:ASCH domain-containing protein n=1 Tax=Ornithinimicrobium sediminis TaxID=2904603 RepID=UPI001E295582|nr:ASCH domain-containing protein [Ornithinimicrobium sediminis]MCE0486053.1 ASCH domain-containing protein [Ornithinimicrobium sediminis]